MTTVRRERLLPPILLALTVLALAPVRKAPARPQEAGETPRQGGVLRIKGFPGPFNRVFDPAQPSHYFVTEQLYDGLVRFDDHFNPMPSLAEYWTISDGGSRITFKLRRGVRFHNGRELTAADVKYSLERLVRNRPGNTYYQYFTRKVVGAEEYWQGAAAEVSGFRAVDPATFEIRWTRPFGSTGLYLLGMYYCKVLPKALLESQGKRFFERPVGTGPFKFAEWIRSPRLEILGVRLERNGTYHERRPYLSAIEYSPNYTEDQFESGGVHLVTVTSEKILRGRRPVLENTTLRSYFLALSCDVPPFDRPEVRRALAMGLDKARLAAAYDTPPSAHQVLDNHIPPLLPGFFPRPEAPQPDPAAAKMLLGRLLGPDGARNLKLALLLPSPRTDPLARFARELERQLAALGFAAETVYLRRPEDVRNVLSPYLKLLEHTMDFPDPENIIVPLYHSRSAANGLGSRYAEPRLDALLEWAEVEPSWERRAGLFREVEKILFRDAPAVPLFSERIRIALQPEVRGVRIPAMGFVFLDTRAVWLESR